MKTFIENEIMCEQVFNEEGPFWHLYTDGTIMENVFTSDELMKNAPYEEDGFFRVPKIN